MKCRRAGVTTPAIYLVDEDNSRLYTEKIAGGSVKEYMRAAYKRGTIACGDQRMRLEDSTGGVAVSDPNYGPDALKLAYSIGVAIAKMHDADIVHGDLTTSNLMLGSADATDVVRLRLDRESK
jgi:TP53 regulating kinase-like protein